MAMTPEQIAAQDLVIADLTRKEKELEIALREARLARAAAWYCLVCLEMETRCACAPLNSSAGKVVQG